MIENAGPSDRQATGEVNEIIEIFPYCQSAYMLLLKGLQNTSDVRFENQLRRSAMRIADREVLYYFLKEEKEVKKEPESEIQAQDFSDSVAPDSQQVVIETAKNSEDLINEIEKSEREGMPEETRDEELYSGQRPVFIQAESDNGDSPASLFFLDDESETEEERVIFMDPGFSVPEEQEKLLELDTDNLITSSDEERVREEQHYIEEDQEGMKQKQSELIDKFILTNPRIDPAREKSEAPQEDISKPSTEEKGEFVTETLAKIYTGQGYYSRAIDIYEKLSLKFTEKSSYFASQIEKVKELIKK